MNSPSNKSDGRVPRRVGLIPTEKGRVHKHRCAFNVQTWLNPHELVLQSSLRTRRATTYPPGIFGDTS